MTNQHPITPPPELVRQWLKNHYDDVRPESIVVPSDSAIHAAIHIATQAARWGADQEWLILNGHCQAVGRPNTARRPKPQPSLKEHALDRCNDYIDPDGIIRRALEQLP